MEKPDIVFSADELAKLRGPIVYVLWDCRKDPVYVGVGTRGAGRPLDPLHHVLGNRKGERLEIFCCKTADEAAALERKMISELSPRKNRQTGGPTRAAERGIHRQPNGSWRAFIRVRGRLLSKCFPADTPIAVVRQWRRAIRGEADKASVIAYMEQKVTEGYN